MPRGPFQPGSVHHITVRCEERGQRFFLTWHADALEAAYLVQAGGLVHAGVGQTLVDVQLAARPHVALQALALERAFGVQTLPRVLARVGA